MFKKLKRTIRETPFLYKTFYFLKYLPDEIVSISLFFKNSLPKPDSRKGFHGDKIWREFFKKIISSLPISSISETGTFQGNTTAFLAENFGGSINTCEIKRRFFRESKLRLKAFPKVSMFRGNSPVFLRRLKESGTLGSLPLFFLDAHWYDYWPLKDEMEIIASLPKAIVMIDDYKVPGREDFGYDIYDFSEKHIDSDIGYLLKILPISKNDYRFFFPSYSSKEAFPGNNDGPLRGYAVVFQNCGEMVSMMEKDSFLKSHYKEYIYEKTRA